jgi:hypothetical protein
VAVEYRSRIQLQLRRKNMRLVELMEREDERTSRELAAIEAYVPRFDKLSRPAPILVRKAQHLDVDGVLARSLPKLGAFSSKDVKTVVLHKPSEV